MSYLQQQQQHQQYKQQQQQYQQQQQQYQQQQQQQQYQQQQYQQQQQQTSQQQQINSEGGRCQFEDGGWYAGKWDNGMAHGYGVCVTGPQIPTVKLPGTNSPQTVANDGTARNSGEFAGLWQQGFEVSGVYKWADGESYEGQWIQGKKHGLGKESKDRYIYKGEWSQGTKGRYGVKSCITGNGLKYEGTWSNGLQDGYGIETYPDGGTYHGQFMRGVRHGYGVRQSAPYAVTLRSGNETMSSVPSPMSPMSTLSSISTSSTSYYHQQHPQQHQQRQYNDNLSSVSKNYSDNYLSMDRDRKTEECRGGFVLQSRTTPMDDAHHKHHKKHGLFDRLGRPSLRRTLANELKIIRQKSTGDLINQGVNVNPRSQSSVPNPNSRAASSGGSVRSTSSAFSQISSALSTLTSSTRRSSIDDIDDELGSFCSDVDLANDRVTEVYSGEWKNDKRSGYGVCERSDGVKHEGEWMNNRKHGYGVTTLQDGTRLEGKYKNNVLVNTGKGGSKLFALKANKIKDRVDAATSAAQKAASQAVQKMEIANVRMTSARVKADQVDEVVRRAVNDSETAKNIAKQYTANNQGVKVLANRQVNANEVVPTNQQQQQQSFFSKKFQPSSKHQEVYSANQAMQPIDQRMSQTPKPHQHKKFSFFKIGKRAKSETRTGPFTLFGNSSLRSTSPTSAVSNTTGVSSFQTPSSQILMQKQQNLNQQQQQFTISSQQQLQQQQQQLQQTPYGLTASSNFSNVKNPHLNVSPITIIQKDLSPDPNRLVQSPQPKPESFQLKFITPGPYPNQDNSSQGYEQPTSSRNPTAYDDSIMRVQVNGTNSVTNPLFKQRSVDSYDSTNIGMNISSGGSSSGGGYASINDNYSQSPKTNSRFANLVGNEPNRYPRQGSYTVESVEANTVMKAIPVKESTYTVNVSNNYANYSPVPNTNYNASMSSQFGGQQNITINTPRNALTDRYRSGAPSSAVWNPDVTQPNRDQMLQRQQLEQQQRMPNQQFMDQQQQQRQRQNLQQQQQQRRQQYENDTNAQAGYDYQKFSEMYGYNSDYDQIDANNRERRKSLPSIVKEQPPNQILSPNVPNAAAFANAQTQQSTSSPKSGGFFNFSSSAAKVLPAISNVPTDTYVIENGIRKRVKPTSASIKTRESFKETATLAASTAKVPHYELEVSSKIPYKRGDRGSLPDVSVVKDTEVMPREVVYQMSQRRREEIMRQREELERRYNSNVIFRVEDILDWLWRNKFVLLVIIVNVLIVIGFHRLMKKAQR